MQGKDSMMLLDNRNFVDVLLKTHISYRVLSIIVDGTNSISCVFWVKTPGRLYYTKKKPGLIQITTQHFPTPAQ